MSYEVTIEPLGRTIEVAEGQTILDAALRCGIYLPHACCHGLCATCKVQVTDGEVDLGAASPFALMDTEREDGKCLACCATPLSDVTIEADIDEEPDALHIPVRDFTGRVAQLLDLTPTVKGVFIEIPERIKFQAGQYVNLKIPGEDKPRAFSLAASPASDGLIELNARRVPGGKGTGFIHDELKVGDPIELTGPLGHFYVRRSDPQPAIFLAGGSGLSSPKSMILDMLESGDSRVITLIYGARNRSELYYHDFFLELAKKHSNFRYVPALNEPTDECAWDGFKGFVHDAAKASFGNDFRGHKAYMCGPPVMIEACIRTLMQGRLYERDIYNEKFLTNADASQGLARSPLFRNI